jgi:hypothetical protein
MRAGCHRSHTVVGGDGAFTLGPRAVQYSILMPPNSHTHTHKHTHPHKCHTHATHAYTLPHLSLASPLSTTHEETRAFLRAKERVATKDHLVRHGVLAWDFLELIPEMDQPRNGRFQIAR